ncbi:MAG: PP2C family serine/threonine-protein phosphatase [Oscillospiraceae bacterium]
MEEQTKKLSDSDVTAHTASLWKYEPIPEEPEAYPEYRSSYDDANGTEIIAARVRGKKHKHEGTNCDDWYEFDKLDDWSICVVSDGAGSKKLSRIGARISSEAACAYIKEQLSAIGHDETEKALAMPFDNADFTAACTKLAEIMRSGFSAAYSAVEGAYLIRMNDEKIMEDLGRPCEIKDFSATLLAAAVIPLANGETFVISVTVGDGMVASVNAEGDLTSALKLLGNTDKGGFSGETEFLDETKTAEKLYSNTKIMRGKVSSVLMMTDGVSDDYYPNSPELLRLYLDLMLNGVIDFPTTEVVSTEGSSAEGREAPQPESYPWVNDSSIEVSLAYAKNIAEKNELALKQLWGERFGELIHKSSLEAFGITLAESRSERLKVWLDNYSQRGSFDDRTLVIISPKGVS